MIFTEKLKYFEFLCNKTKFHNYIRGMVFDNKLIRKRLLIIELQN
jgi:hypothetical protein